jgi:hypothetical protein
MAYVGTPIDTTNQFQSLQGKRFSGDASTTAFTLDIAPSSVFDIEVFVENVRQDPNSAYSISGTTLTFTGAPPSGTNNIYVVHQAKAVGTINPTNDSVTASSIADDAVESEHLNDNIISGQTALAATPATTDELLISDAGTIKRIDAQFFQATPAFRAFHSSTQNVSNTTLTTLSFDSETFDSDGTYDTSNGRFTPAIAGKYVIFAHIRVDDTNSYQFEVEIRTSAENAIAKGVVVNANKNTNFIYTIADLSADEYVFVTAYHSQGGTRTLLGGTSQAYFGGFKIIGA